MAVIAGLLGWNYGVRQLGVVVASLFLNFVPAFTILITTLQGRPPTTMQLLGGALVLAGVLQSQLRHLPWWRRAGGHGNELTARDRSSLHCNMMDSQPIAACRYRWRGLSTIIRASAERCRL